MPIPKKINFEFSIERNNEPLTKKDILAIIVGGSFAGYTLYNSFIENKMSVYLPFELLKQYLIGGLSIYLWPVTLGYLFTL